ncbi:hypothetical protein C943_03291 [Mariniradius saccharolyticus AK6]|uniref:Uncharacterized protein n=1 Tax=Mariniradius saccharolyticus AK6 TaxID=1239962 RepID=M7XIE2_9BACT|nr:hypothetical protein C943_03291 [Mariniradius saccharolyticus AK6]
MKGIQDIIAEQITEMPDPGITVVIPFKASAAKGNELQYALRAWDKHFPGCRIAIIGDSLPWFGKEILHIPMDTVSDNPQIDVAHKMAAAIASDLIPQDFIWSNDDIYTLCPITLADIVTLKAHGKLSAKGLAEGLYRKNADRTLKALKEAGIDEPYDFATHTPVALGKNLLSEVLHKFKCLDEGHLVYSLYANYFFVQAGYRPTITYNDARGSIVAAVYRANPDADLLKKAFETRKWINNNDGGWKAVEPYLQKLFPDKCRFEK